MTRSARSRGRTRSSPAARAGSAARSSVELARAGAEVVFGYRSGADEAAELAAEIGARAVQADVSSAEEAARLVEEAGDLDILVNNAGLTRDGLLARMSDDDWRAVIETNLSSVFYTCRAVTTADDEEARGLDRQHQLDRRPARQLGPDELRRVEGGDHRLHEVARARARLARRARERGRAGLREVAADRRAARGGDAGDAREHAARPARRARRTSPARYGFSAPTRPRSSRARCCSSTADWGCSGGRERQRTQAGRRHRDRDGQLARQRRRVVLAARSSRASPARPRSRSSTTATTRSTSRAS